MMINRRRICGGTSIKNPYITDGLVFYLDGEYNNGFASHESDINYWKELVSGMNLQPSGTISWGDNYGYFNGNSYFDITIFGANIVPLINNNTIYIEMILKPVNHGSQGNNGYIAFGNNVRGVWLWDNPGYQYASYAYKRDTYDPITLYGWSGQKKINRILISPNKVTIDRDNNKSNNNSTVKSNNCYIGCLPGFGNGIFRLYCLRVYNRVLSANEVSANYTIDQQRFGII